jgi:hypothetical protein
LRRALLRAAGHRAFTPTLTGLGDRAHFIGPNVGLAAFIQTWAPGVGSGAPHDLMISSFDNQRASSEKANASKIRLNALKR